MLGSVGKDMMQVTPRAAPCMVQELITFHVTEPGGGMKYPSEVIGSRRQSDNPQTYIVSRGAGSTSLRHTFLSSSIC